MRWLTGSLNGTSWAPAVPALVALAVLTPVLLAQSRNLAAPQLGDDTAVGAGRPRRADPAVVAIVAAVGLIAFATAAAGPIAFVAFLSGPIAARSSARAGRCWSPPRSSAPCWCWWPTSSASSPSAPATRSASSPACSARPYLVYLIVRTNRAGGSL